MVLMDLWNEAKTLAPLAAAVIALYVSLKLRPIERDIEELEKEHARLDLALEQHLKEATEGYHNFDRWRGEVTESMRQNSRDHEEIKLALGRLMNMHMKEE